MLYYAVMLLFKKAMVYPAYAHTHRILRGRRYNDYSNLLTACEEMWTGHIRSPFLLSLLVDIYEEDGSEPKILEAIKVSTVVENYFFLGVYPLISESEDSIFYLVYHFLQLCRLLADEVDSIRKPYWDYEAKRLEQINMSTKPHPPEAAVAD